MRLTDLSVQRQKSDPRGQITCADDALPGFGLRVSPAGTKAFVLVVGRGRKRITIGRYPVITLSEARARAREILAKRVLGKAEAERLRFEEAIPIFLASQYPINALKPRTGKEIGRILRRHFLPPFREHDVAIITAREVATIIDRMHATPSMARHAFAAIRMFFRWAQSRQYVERSPCAELRPPRLSSPRERVLAHDDLRAVLQAAQASDTTFAKIVLLLALTGQRRGEIAALRGEWIDFEGRTITFPSRITKNKRPHTIPFGMRAEAVLRTGNTKGLLFPGRGTELPFDGWSKCKPKFDIRCPLEHWTLHDLRRTFATNLAALGVPIHVTEKLLNHISGTMGGIVAVYQRHSYEREMREAMSLWEHEIDRIVTDAGDRTGASTTLHTRIAA